MASPLSSSSSKPAIAGIARNLRVWAQTRLPQAPNHRTTSELPLIKYAVESFHLKAQSMLQSIDVPSYLPPKSSHRIQTFYTSHIIKLKQDLADELRFTLEKMHRHSSGSLRSVAQAMVAAYVLRSQKISSAFHQRIADYTRAYVTSQQFSQNVVDSRRGFNAVRYRLFHRPLFPTDLEEM